MLAPDGTAMIVEPMAGERVEENLHPLGRLFSGVSTLVCTPSGLTDDGVALGTLAIEESLHAVATAAGFIRFRRATQTVTNRVFEARP